MAPTSSFPELREQQHRSSRSKRLALAGPSMVECSQVQRLSSHAIAHLAMCARDSSLRRQNSPRVGAARLMPLAARLHQWIQNVQAAHVGLNCRLAARRVRVGFAGSQAVSKSGSKSVSKSVSQSTEAKSWV
mmetsp:Transcript_8341/g.26436  ORF Transcript_8341/g.26436 Transcript_8341/m.26436 type:complete len:132 (-) Transcript_8341:925-1320(-)